MSRIKTIDIRGKSYVTVVERLKYFRTQEKYANWSIKEEVVHIDDKEGVFKVSIMDASGVEMSSAHSQEYRGSSNINKTSFLENGFTSALGRALGYLGIGVDASVASFEEVANAISNQEKKETLTQYQFEMTMKGTDKEAQTVLDRFDVPKEYLVQIKNKFNI